jgi:hypothetical protein
MCEKITKKEDTICYDVAGEHLGFCNSYSGFRLNVSGGICFYFKYYGINIEKI